MLKENEPADYITYYFNNLPIRIHKHTDDGSLWIVLKDLCDALNITNASYVSSKTDKKNIIKHKILNSKNRRKVLWINLKAVHFLAENSNTPNGKEFYSWIIDNTNKDYIPIKKELLVELANIITKINTFLHII